MVKKSLSEKIYINSLASLALVYISPMDKSLRWEKINYNKDYRGVIFAVWHGSQYGLLSFRGEERSRLNLLISPSNDGDIIATISEKLGYPTIRGSHKRRGARAVMEIDDALGKGQNVAYTVDGPKGPIYGVKKGIIKIAEISQKPIVPLVPHVLWKMNAKSWDKYQIPFHFTRAVAIFGDPINVPKGITAEEEELYRKNLEENLLNMHKKALSHFEN